MKAAKLCAVICCKFRTRPSNLKDVYTGSLLTWNWKTKMGGRRIEASEQPQRYGTVHNTCAN